MRLLQKREIDTAKAKDRSMEVAEGLKLSKRVDSLREVVAHEEASLEKFRRESLAEIYDQITTQTKVRDVISNEVMKLEERKREALKPVTALEETLKEQGKELESKKIDLGTWQMELNARHIALNSRDKDNVIEQKRLEDMHTTTREKLLEADTLKRDTEKKHQVAVSVLEDAQEKGSTIIFEANLKRLENEKTRRELQAKEQELQSREKEVEKQWVLIKDREGTLQRNIKRLTK